MYSELKIRAEQLGIDIQPFINANLQTQDEQRIRFKMLVGARIAQASDIEQVRALYDLTDAYCAYQQSLQLGAREWGGVSSRRHHNANAAEETLSQIH